MGAKLQTAPPASKTTGSPSKETAAERRQVTVMLSDLVGYMALSARVDPCRPRQDHFGVKEVRCEGRAAVRRFVAKYLGNGVLNVLRPSPAHKNDAERAVRAISRQDNTC
jgi:class 3 adenylate cyclase